MNRIIVSDEEKNTVFEIEGKAIKGCSFYNDGRLEPTTTKDLEIFNAFRLSNNKTNLPNEGEYQVILDNNTGFKHYYFDGREDYIMFFENNGEEVTESIEETIETRGWRRREKLAAKEKKFHLGKFLIRCTCLGLLGTMLTLTFINVGLPYVHPDREYKILPVIEMIFGKEDLTVDYLVDRIYASENITDEDQLFLANKDLLNDILPYVNRSNFAKYTYEKRFRNINIKTFDNTGMRCSGFYNSGDPNSLHIAEQYLDSDAYYNDIISHEFIHLCQMYCKYNVIAEACAEILSYEYFDECPTDSYKEEVYLIRKLMEIIGSEPILEYMFAQDFSGIENGVKPYLTDNEYQIFLSDLQRPDISSDKYNDEEVNAKHESLNYLLDTIYERKYDKSSEQDIAIPHLKEKSLVRYYFNSRKKKESYFFVSSNPKENISLEEAVRRRIVFIYQTLDNGEIKNVSFNEYEYSRYDTNRPIQFRYNTQDDVELVLGDDDKLHAIITPYDNHLRAYIPSVDEKLEQMETQRKR